MHSKFLQHLKAVYMYGCYAKIKILIYALQTLFIFVTVAEKSLAVLKLIEKRRVYKLVTSLFSMSCHWGSRIYNVSLLQAISKHKDSSITEAVLPIL